MCSAWKTSTLEACGPAVIFVYFVISLQVLLISERFNWIESRRFPRRRQAESQTEPDRHHNSDKGRPDRDQCREDQLDKFRGNRAELNPEQATHYRQSGGFNKKLQDDVAPFRTNRFSHSDLSCPIGD